MVSQQLPQLQCSDNNNNKSATPRRRHTDHGLGHQSREHSSCARRVMAPSKRKRKPTRSTTNKRPKYALPDTDCSSSEEEEIQHDSQEEWEALCILQQRGQGFALEYEIAWVGIDPATGKQWAPTWENAGNASEALRASWKDEQARRAREEKAAAAVDKRSTQRQGARGASRAQATQNHSTRTLESAEPSASASTGGSPTETSQSAARIPITASADPEPPLPDLASPQVNIDLRGDSFNRREYELHAEIPESQSSPPKSGVGETEPESSQLFASQPAFRASGVVLDTQSSAGAASYIPVTQEELASSLLSESSDGSNEDHIVGYSHLLDIDGAPKLGARAPSPATSIAETVADTTQDPRSQHRIDTQQELSGVPETSESRSPATSDKTDRTGTQNELDISHAPGSFSAEPCTSIEQHQVDPPVRFVENTTQFDHDSSALGSGLHQSEQDEPSLTTQQKPKAAETLSTQFATDIEHSVLLAVADTPQVSQLKSTAQGKASQEAQSGSAHQLDSVQPSAEYESEITLTEHSVWEEDAQFPFHSQRPASFDPRSATKLTQRALTEPPRTSEVHEHINTRLAEITPNIQQENNTPAASDESTTIDEISQPISEEAPHTSPAGHALSQQSQIHTDDEIYENRVLGDTHNIVDQASLSENSESRLSTEQSSGSHEHNAQFIPSNAYSTQKDVVESILATIEIGPTEAPHSKHSSPGSRHDSSQETPDRNFESVAGSPSPIAHPPSYSLRILDADVPPRPATPTVTSSLSRMTEGTAESGAAYARRRIDELLAEKRERRRSRNASIAAATDAATNDAASQSNNTLALPTFNISAEGTRSPSTVPDRSPAPPPNTSLRTVPATTSLRAVAFYNANKVTEPLLVDPPVVTPNTADKSPTEKSDDLVTAVTAATAHSIPIAPSLPTAHDDFENNNDDDDEDMDNDENASNVDSIDDYDDDDDESIYDDELKLEDEEYIVPLYIEGRQRNTYTEYIKQKEELLNEVLVHSPAPIEKLDEVDRALAYLKGVETHPDLIYAEAESATEVESRTLADVVHGAQFGIDNSVKFKFLGRLFDRIRDKKMHIVLLLDEDNKALLNIVTTFLVAGGYNFKMPSNGRQSPLSQDSLSITVFPRPVTPVLSPVDLIICLDGVQDAARARQRKVSASGKAIPVLHLVIPQTVGHIERYILPTTERRLRIETILAALARMQTRNEVGNAIDIDTPSAVEAAQMVTSWLFPEEDQELIDWPLPSIGSARSFIEWDATQPSVRSAESSPAPERSKRHLEQEGPDPVKRMRYTSQPPAVANSSAMHEPEVTRVSDSMPGTAASENARLAASLEKVTTALLQERKERREESVMWDRQQTEHENRQEQYRKLFNEKAAADRALETMTTNREKIRGQIDVQSSEIRTLREELEALRALSLASSDEKDVEITRLRKELEFANLEREKALNSAKSQEGMMDFLKDNYRDAQNAAAELRTEVDTLTSQNTKLAHQASGEVAKLKQIHLDKSTKNLMQQNKALQSENATLKATLKAKEDELVRTKNNSGRAAYGTRGQSTTPQPKTRSRAASPERGSRAPRGGGRISNLVAEER